MSEPKKSIAQKLQEKSQAAKEAAVRRAEAVGQGAQKGGAAVALGAHAVSEGVQKGGLAAAHLAGEGAEQCGHALAEGAKMAGEGAHKGVQVVKEHPKETAIIAGAAVVAAGALPFTPFGVPAAAGFVAAVAQSAKTTQDALQSPDPDGLSSAAGEASAADGLITGIAAGATAAQTVLNKGHASEKPQKK